MKYGTLTGEPGAGESVEAEAGQEARMGAAMQAEYKAVEVQSMYFTCSDGQSGYGCGIDRWFR